MEFDQYKEELYEKAPARKVGRRILMSMLAVLLVFGVTGVLVVGLIGSIRMPGPSAVLPWSGWTQEPDATDDPNDFGDIFPDPVRPQVSPRPAAPTPTPFYTERPMIDLDGELLQLPLDGNPIPDLVDAVATSVVGINNYMELGQGGPDTLRVDRLQAQGSGFVISSSGYVLTNAHVVAEAYEASITLNDGTEVPAEILGMDSKSDVAVLKVDYPGLKPLKLGNSDSIRVGDYVVAIGNALGWLEGSVTLGIVSASARAVTIDRETNLYIQTDAAINVGNSGGPLLNLQGEVIGVNTAKSISAGYDAFGGVITAEGLGFALPINKVLNIATQLITTGHVRRAALGIMVQGLQYEELERMGLDNGIRVRNVVEGAPAHAAGIKEGDIIVACDGYKYEDQNELTEYISALAWGTTVEIELYRDGRTITVQAVLTDMDHIEYPE